MNLFVIYMCCSVKFVEQVKLGILLDYAKAAGIIIAILLLLSFAGVDAFAIASNIWLSKWSDANKDKK